MSAAPNKRLPHALKCPAEPWGRRERLSTGRQSQRKALAVFLALSHRTLIPSAKHFAAREIPTFDTLQSVLTCNFNYWIPITVSLRQGFSVFKKLIPAPRLLPRSIMSVSREARAWCPQSLQPPGESVCRQGWEPWLQCMAGFSLSSVGRSSLGPSRRTSARAPGAREPHSTPGSPTD